MTFRCPACRTTRKDYTLFLRHVRTSGHRVCTCGGYHHVHRPGSPCCEQNPMSAYHDAVRRGATSDELEDVLMDFGVPTSGEPPF